MCSRLVSREADGVAAGGVAGGLAGGHWYWRVRWQGGEEARAGEGAPLIISPSPSLRPAPRGNNSVYVAPAALSPVYLSRHNIYSMPQGSGGTHRLPPVPSVAAPAPNVTEQPKVWGRVAKMGAGGVQGVGRARRERGGEPGVYTPPPA